MGGQRSAAPQDSSDEFVLLLLLTQERERETNLRHVRIFHICISTGYNMSLDAASIQRLCQELARDRDIYLASLQKAHEALARALTKYETQIHVAGTMSPLQQESEGSADITTSDIPSSTNETSELSPRGHFVPQQTLPSESFSEADFKHHLRTYEWNDASHRLLDGIIGLRFGGRNILLGEDPLVTSSSDPQSYLRVDSVGLDGIPHPILPPGAMDASSVWRVFSSTNDSTSRHHSAGKIALACEPASLTLAIMHMAYNPHFDMDTIFSELVSEAPSAATMDGCFDSDPRRQRSFTFTLKYYTVVGAGRTPMPWQRADSKEKLTSRAPDHIPLSSCCSVFALSLSGVPVSSVNSGLPSRRTRSAASGMCHIFDPFSPWLVLSMHFCPDWHTTISQPGSHIDERYVNGPEAFLSNLLLGFQNCADRLDGFSKLIEKLVIPPVLSQPHVIELRRLILLG
jgi:hypothetical protein